ncbi:hypothetical protein ACFVUS_25500 [Nocardia sp. NPDC058058]|uniref:hypothetical protein n=1 Tax=Nocardia sp. NPDC058058 TaxID=3346317 RepID=UPI0036DA1F0A
MDMKTRVGMQGTPVVVVADFGGHLAVVHAQNSFHVIGKWPADSSFQRKLQPTAWRVIVGVGNGHLDSGVHQDWLDEDMPREIRRPNAFFYITTDYSE